MESFTGDGDIVLTDDRKLLVRCNLRIGSPNIKVPLHDGYVEEIPGLDTITGRLAPVRDEDLPLFKKLMEEGTQYLLRLADRREFDFIFDPHMDGRIESNGGIRTRD